MQIVKYYIAVSTQFWIKIDVFSKLLNSVLKSTISIMFAISSTKSICYNEVNHSQIVFCTAQTLSTILMYLHNFDQKSIYFPKWLNIVHTSIIFNMSAISCTELICYNEVNHLQFVFCTVQTLNAFFSESLHL
jgi:hypothetical protein